MRHSGEEFRKLAEEGTILRCLVGSRVHGLGIAAQDDRDEMGICLEPSEYIIGLKNFEQYQYRSAAERTGKADARSGPGDLDLIIYSARKWMRLALQGNPTVLMPLFVSDDDMVQITNVGRDLRAHKDMILSRQAGKRFSGYLHAQRVRLLGGKHGSDVSRPELIEAYGFDTKFAGHMVRLGLQGVELLETGHITLPMSEPWRSWIRDLRVGKHSQQEALDVSEELEEKLEKLTHSSSLPEHPDYAAANQWLIETYQNAWCPTYW